MNKQKTLEKIALAGAVLLLQDFPHMTLAQAQHMIERHGCQSWNGRPAGDAAWLRVNVRAWMATATENGEQFFGTMHELLPLKLAAPGYVYYPGHSLAVPESAHLRHKTLVCVTSPGPVFT